MHIKPNKQWFLKTWREWRVTLFLIVFVILPVKSTLADFNWVPTGSMNPTILEGDFVLVNKAAYDLRIPFTLSRLTTWSDPARGDIVICFSPQDGTRLIKRIVGLPGDTLSMERNQLYINNKPARLYQIKSSTFEYLNPILHQQGRFAMEDLGDIIHPVMSLPGIRAKRSFPPMTVPVGHYFVMGDNRDNSLDSRMFGLVQRRAIIGKAVGIAASLNIKDKYQLRLKRFFSQIK